MQKKAFFGFFIFVAQYYFAYTLDNYYRLTSTDMVVIQAKLARNQNCVINPTIWVKLLIKLNHMGGGSIFSHVSKKKLKQPVF